MNLWQHLTQFFGGEPAEERAQLSETENEFLVGATPLAATEFDRPAYSRQELLQQCLDAWRYNPLARRIVEITSQYVVGGGYTVSAADAVTQQVVKRFWNHRYNRMDARLIEMCDELTRSGNLFILIGTDAGGMSYLRMIPATLVAEINTKENDLEQETAFTLRSLNGQEPITYGAYDPQMERFDQLKPCVVHYTVNKPAGAVWGESDLAPLLKWLMRYSSFLDDRVRLNRYRNAFMYVVKSTFVNDTTRRARLAQLAANPPQPGSILVTDESENWSVLAPKLESSDAEKDGLAIKKMIASGAGISLHFLAEPESSTRTTAEASGGPTYRKFQQRQLIFVGIIKDLLEIVLNRYALITGKRMAEEVEVHPGDLSGRDNVALAMAGTNIMSAFETLREAGAVSKEEMVRVLYRFIGEEGDPAEIVKEGQAEAENAGSEGSVSKQKRKPKGAKIDHETGDIRTPGLE